MVLRTQGWTIKENVIVGNRADQLLLDTSGWKHFMESLYSDNNLWYKSDKGQAFKIGSRVMDFDKWRSTTGQDSSSVFVEPPFKDPDNPRSGLLSDAPAPLPPP
jgi:hypothetical protein